MATSLTVRSIVDEVDALLPQTQCRRCGYAACRPYAEALVRGVAAVNRCAPGGPATIAALSRALGVAPLAPDPDCGVQTRRLVALIDETRCIGCRLCLRACPVDAVIGAPRRMHAVIADECNGCALCVEPCPVDCIALVTPSRAPRVQRLPEAPTATYSPPLWMRGWSRSQAERARRRHAAREQRLARRARARAAQAACRDVATDRDRRKAIIRDAVARVHARRESAGRCG